MAWRCDTPAADAELGENEGLAAVDADAVPERQHSDLLRHLRAILDALLAGQITVLDAHNPYGVQRATRGRPRRFVDFAAFLDDQIRYAEDPAVERQLCRLLARSGRRRAQTASADTERVNRLLAETGSERAERLRDLRAGAEWGALTEPAAIAPPRGWRPHQWLSSPDASKTLPTLPAVVSRPPTMA